MNTQFTLFYAYLIIGLIVTAYDWQKYQKPTYDKYKEMGTVEDGMAIIYMLGVTLFWPIKLLSYIH